MQSLDLCLFSFPGDAPQYVWSVDVGAQNQAVIKATQKEKNGRDLTSRLGPVMLTLLDPPFVDLRRISTPTVSRAVGCYRALGFSFSLPRLLICGICQLFSALLLHTPDPSPSPPLLLLMFILLYSHWLRQFLRSFFEFIIN